jgi:lipopolysaccharide exporter
MSDNNSRVLNSIKWNYLGAAVRMVMIVGVQIVLFRLMGPDAVGGFAFYLLLVGLGSIVAEGGFSTALTRAKDVSSADLAFAAGWILVTSASVALLLAAGSSWIVSASNLGPDYVWVVFAAAFVMVPQALLGLPNAVLRRRFAFREIQLISLASYAVGFVGVGLTLSLFMQSVWVLIAAFSTQVAVTLLATWWLARVRLRATLRGSRELGASGAKSLATNVLFFLNDSVDNWLVLRFFGSEALGAYSAAFNLGRTPTEVINASLHSPMLVATALDHADGSIHGQRFAMVLSVAAFLLVPCYLFVALHGTEIIALIYGDEWELAGPVLSALAIAMLARLASGICTPFLWGRDRGHYDTIIQFVTLVAFVCGLLLVSGLDLVAAAWVTAGAYWLRALLHIFGAQKAVHVTLRRWGSVVLTAAFVGLLGNAPAFLVALWARSALPDWQGLLLACAVFGITMLALLAAAFVVGSPAWVGALVRRVLRRASPNSPPGTAAS